MFNITVERPENINDLEDLSILFMHGGLSALSAHLKEGKPLAEAPWTVAILPETGDVLLGATPNPALAGRNPYRAAVCMATLTAEEKKALAVFQVRFEYSVSTSKFVGFLGKPQTEEGFREAQKIYRESFEQAYAEDPESIPAEVRTLVGSVTLKQPNELPVTFHRELEIVDGKVQPKGTTVYRLDNHELQPIGVLNWWDPEQVAVAALNGLAALKEIDEPAPATENS